MWQEAAVEYRQVVLSLLLLGRSQRGGISTTIGFHWIQRFRCWASDCTGIEEWIRRILGSEYCDQHQRALRIPRHFYPGCVFCVAWLPNLTMQLPNLTGPNSCYHIVMSKNTIRHYPHVRSLQLLYVRCQPPSGPDLYVPHDLSMSSSHFTSKWINIGVPIGPTQWWCCIQFLGAVDRFDPYLPKWWFLTLEEPKYQCFSH